MLGKSQFQTLFAYHWHTTRRLIECAAQLDGSGGSEVHGLLFHLLTVDWSWRIGLETGKQPQPPRQEQFADLAALRAGFDREETAWGALLEQLGDEQFAQDVELTALTGYVLAMPRWRVLMQVTLHGMQHHAELAQLLTARGQSPGDIDFLFFRG